MIMNEENPYMRNLEILRLVMGDEETAKLSYSEQLNRLIDGYSLFVSRNDARVLILSMIHKQVTKKYPNLSKEKSLDMATNIFIDSESTSKINENIKKVVLTEARKRVVKSILKNTKNTQSNKSLHIKAANKTKVKQNMVNTDEPKPIGFLTIVIILAVIFLMLSLFE